MRRLKAIDRLLTPERLKRYPLALLAVTAVIYLAGAARSHDWIEPGGKLVGRDFIAFFMAGDMVAQGRADRLYNVAAQTEYQNRFMDGINPRWTGVCLYLNPPHYAWAISWITRLGYGQALGVWWLASLAAFALTALIWLRWIAPGSARTPIILAVCMPAWFLTLAGGQNTFFSLLVLTGFCALLMRGRDAAAGFVLALLGYKFQLLLLPAALLLYKRRWRALGGLAAGGFATIALVAVGMGPDLLLQYLRLGSQLPDLMQFEGFDVYKQHSWYGFFQLLGEGWLTPSVIRMLTVVAVLATLAVLIRVWRGDWNPKSPRFAFQLAALIVAAALTSPHLFHYDTLILTLPAILAVRAASAPDHSVRLKAVLALGFVWLAIAGPLAPLIRFQLSPFIMLVWLLVLRGAVASREPADVPASTTRLPAAEPV